MPARRHELLLPDLGLAEETVAVSLWLVEPGCEVTEGDRLVELIAGSVTVDLPSPASGVLERTFVEEDEPLQVGQRLATILEMGDSTPAG